MSELLDYAERAGMENMKERAQNADALHKEAHTLLALFLSGAGAALYFSAKQEALSGVALIISFWLFSIALVLAWKCLMYGDYPAIWNEPKSLYQPALSLDVIRQLELDNLQARIIQATALNVSKSYWLNTCIIAACATPVIAALAWGVWVRGFSA